MDPNDTFTDLYNNCVAWRRHLHRSYRAFADIDSVIGLSMWEHFCNGVTSERELFRVVSVDVRRYVRREHREWAVVERLRFGAGEQPRWSSRDSIETAIDRLGIAQQMSAVPVPAKAQAWAAHVVSDTPTRISDAERIAGLRWAKTARKALANV